MANDLGKATITFDGNNAAMIKSIDEISAKLNGLKTGADAGGGGWISSLLSPLGLLSIGATAAFGSVVYGTVKANERLADLSRTARSVGTDASRLKSLNYVAGQFNATADQVAAGLKHVRDAYPDLDSIDVFEATRDKMKEMGPGAEAAALAYETFGEAGRGLYETLMASNQEFDHYVEQSKNFGQNSEHIQKVEQAQSAYKRLGNAWNAATQTFFELISIRLAPWLEWLSEKCEAFAADTTIGTNLVNTAWEWMIYLIEKAANVAQILYGVFAMFFGFFSIGVGIVVQGLNYIVKAVEWVVEKITGLTSTLSESIDKFANGMKDFGVNAVDSGLTALQDDWWGDKFKDLQKEVESKPLKPKVSFDNDYVPESKQRELDEQKLVGLGELPAAILQGSKEAYSIAAKFEQGMLLDKNSDKADKAKELDMQRQIRDAVKANNKPKIAKF